MFPEMLKVIWSLKHILFPSFASLPLYPSLPPPLHWFYESHWWSWSFTVIGRLRILRYWDIGSILTFISLLHILFPRKQGSFSTAQCLQDHSWHKAHLKSLVLYLREILGKKMHRPAHSPAKIQMADYVLPGSLFVFGSRNFAAS